MKTELAQQTAYASPPLAATGAILVGLTLNEWVAAATIVYIVMQAIYLGWKWHQEWKAKQRADSN